MPRDPRKVLEHELPGVLWPNASEPDKQDQGKQDPAPGSPWPKFDPDTEDRHGISPGPWPRKPREFEPQRRLGPEEPGKLSEKLVEDIQDDAFGWGFDVGRGFDEEDDLSWPQWLPGEHDPKEDAPGGWCPGEDAGTGGKGNGHIENCAWYQPYHYSADWGIFIRAHCLERLQKKAARWIARWAPPLSKVSPTKVPSIRACVGLASLRLAALRYYLHEVFHHQAEAYSTRCEVVLGGKSVYIRGAARLHAMQNGDPEEPLAEAYMLKNACLAARNTWAEWMGSTQAEFLAAFPPLVFTPPSFCPSNAPPWAVARYACRVRLAQTVARYTPSPYNRGAFVHYPHELDQWKRKVLLTATGTAPSGISLTTHMTQGYKNQKSPKFWIVVPKGKAPTPSWLPLLERASM